MKSSLARFRWSKPSSFTLVELLVVVGIIAILIALLLNAGVAAYRAAKRAQAANIANQLQTSSMAYYNEYSVYPVPGGTTTDYMINDQSTSQSKWGTLICILCGNIQPYNATPFTTAGATITNSRGIPFLTLKSTDVDSGNAPINPLPPTSTTSTNTYFNIAFDSDYDGVLGVSPSAVTTMPNFAATTFNATAAAGGGTSTAGVAVWVNCNVKTSYTNSGFYEHTY